MVMKRSRRKFTTAFKVKVVLEALKERQTLSELAVKYEVHASQISAWKGEVLQNMEQVFRAGKKKKTSEAVIDTEQLYAKIGKLEMENELLKKSLAKLD
jgi:transposase-like protein